LASLKRFKPDTVILGCTHYPLLKPVIGSVLGPQVRLIDSAQAVAGQVHDLLEARDLAANGALGWTRYFVSDEPHHFTQVGSLFLKDRIRSVHKVSHV